MNICETCGNARNCLNGRYCLALHSYVEYSARSNCHAYTDEPAQRPEPPDTIIKRKRR